MPPRTWLKLTHQCPTPSNGLHDSPLQEPWWMVQAFPGEGEIVWSCRLALFEGCRHPRTELVVFSHLDSNVIHGRNHLRMRVLSSYKLWRYAILTYNSDIILNQIGIFEACGLRHNGNTVSLALSLLADAVISYDVCHHLQANSWSFWPAYQQLPLQTPFLLLFSVWDFFLPRVFFEFVCFSGHGRII